jgi:uncharacterized protein YcnI
MRGKLVALGATISITVCVLAAVPAQAHVSVYPGVSATGSSTAALTAGNSGTLYFRVGHGCTDETGIKSPVTGISMAGTTWPTSVFSVHIPIEATGTGSTIPKPQFIPGFRNTVTKNTDGSYDVSWAAVSRDFYVPDSPEGDGGGKAFFDFGVAVKWKAGITGSDIWLPATQTCPVDMTNKPSEKSPAKLAVTKSGRNTFLQLDGAKKNAKKTVSIDVNGELLVSSLKLDKNGALKLLLTADQKSKVLASGALTTIKSGDSRIAYLGGVISTRYIYNKWDVTDGSGQDTVLDDTEHNTAPKITVQ